MKYHLHIKFKKDSQLPKFLQECFEGEYEVTENHVMEDVQGKFTNNAWSYSFASLRKGLIFEPVAGCAVANPHDLINHETGYRLAFKRAVEALLNDILMILCDQPADTKRKIKKEVIDKFRYARYNALKQLKAEKEK